MMPLDYTILIQGPLEDISLQNLDQYKEYGEVLISHWEEDNTLVLDAHNVDGCRINSRRLDEACSHHSWAGTTFNYQCSSILFGLEQVRTPFVIRTRSDEFYSNLDPLISLFETDRDKIVCGNIFFKRWEEATCHIGDHLFVGRTDVLLAAYREVFNGSHTFKNVNCPEINVALAINYVVNNEWDIVAKEKFKGLFDVIDINLLKPFLARWTLYDVTYKDEFSYLNCIRDIDEL